MKNIKRYIMSKTRKLINNLNEKYELYFNEIDEKISKLEDEREVIHSNYYKDLIETGKSIDLNDVNIHMNNFELLIEGFIIEHGFNESNLNDDFLNLLTISFYLSNNKKHFSKSIEKSFLKLSEKNKLYFCLFLPEHIEYKNYAGGNPLIANKHFKFLSDYLIPNKN